MTDTSQTQLADGLTDAITYARLGERLLGVASRLADTATALTSVVELDPALGPEMQAALTHLHSASDAIQRGMTFLDARYQAKWGSSRE